MIFHIHLFPISAFDYMSKNTLVEHFDKGMEYIYIAENLFPGKLFLPDPLPFFVLLTGRFSFRSQHKWHLLRMYNMRDTYNR